MGTRLPSGGVEEVGGARAENDVVVALAEVDAIAREPCGFADAGIAGR